LQNPTSGKCSPAASNWTNASWQALNFAVDDPFYYQYNYTSNGQGTGSQFTAGAYGDLNCDTVTSTFERIGNVDPQFNVNGGSGLYVSNDIE
jgi:hypothetical protein